MSDPSVVEKSSPRKKAKQPAFRGSPPKKLSRSLRRHLRTVQRQNQSEADAQRSMIG